ncbi:MAG: 4-hydroxythreonine-4-phosphate dehydrogenase PdxA [Gemmatimonadetes bacterium]|nr:4-hydroxythreonine-4-phosphate dehydrogenase PdxA [Gemmatimonadota bacterium]
MNGGRGDRLAVTLGDPRGIGPEVAAAGLRSLRAERPDAHIVLVGPDGADPGLCDYVSVGPFDGSESSAGRTSAEAVRRAVGLALDGRVGAVVTAPIAKPAWHAVGLTAPGHTEFLQELAGAASVGMMMHAERTRLGAPLRVLLATTHLALRDVPLRLSADLLVEQTRLLDRALRDDWGFSAPRLGLCAFNPHASDGGLFGDEEERVYAPALARLRDAGVAAEGPLSADTVFARALEGGLDAVVAPYHDVGMAAFKTVAFGAGVNVTLGLPFVRTSPDHGTAFDLAGTGRADPSSMLEALRLALRLAGSRFDTPPPRK